MEYSHLRVESFQSNCVDGCFDMEFAGSINSSSHLLTPGVPLVWSGHEQRALLLDLNNAPRCTQQHLQIVTVDQ